MKTVEEKSREILLFLRVVRSEGNYSDGTPITNGVNPWNPLTYVVLLVLGLFCGTFRFIKSFIDVWTNAF